MKRRFNFDDTSYFNLLRIICAFAVMLIHIAEIDANQFRIINNCYFLSFLRGSAPVMFFFMLSGFLFNKVYYSKMKSGTLTFGNFCSNRVVKILPFTILTTLVFYIISCVCVYGLNITVIGQGPVNRISTNLVYVFLGAFIGGTEIFTGTWGPLNGALWYINMLIFLYLIACLFTYINKKRNAKFLFALPILLGFGMILSKQNVPFFNYLFGVTLINYFLGFLVYDLFKKMERLSNRSCLIVRIISLLSIAFYCVAFYYFTRIKKDETALSIAENGVNNIIFWIPLLLLLNGKKINTFAKNRFVNFACSLSFDTYMWHLPVIEVILIVVETNHIQTTNGLAYFFIIISIILFISVLTNLFLNNRLRKLAKAILRV